MAEIKSEPGGDHTWVDVDVLRTLVRPSLDGGDATPVVHVLGFGISGR